MNVDFELLSMDLLFIQISFSVLGIRFVFELDIGVALTLAVMIGLELARYDLSMSLEEFEKLLLGYFLFNVLD